MEYPNIEYFFVVSAPMVDYNVFLITTRLSELGFLDAGLIGETFNSDVDKAVRLFQASKGIAANGIVDIITWGLLFEGVDSDIGEENAPEDTEEEYKEFVFGNNNRTSFFNENRKTGMRKNNGDIVITYGNGHRTRTLKNVMFRSKSQVISPSGQPIAETYEFIARDLIESEEN